MVEPADPASPKPSSPLAETLRAAPARPEPLRPWSPKEDLDEEMQSERWLLSYADFITLLMVLFMMLYALQLVKAKDVATSDFRSKPVQASSEPKSTLPTPVISIEKQAFLARISALADQGLVKFSEDARGVELDINATVLFTSGDARLLPQARKILTPVANALKGSAKEQILVEGHTDSVPIATVKYESNWELSSARAGAVVRFFVEQGIEPYRLAAMGRADNVPAALGDDPEALARNRRVTILVRY
jgi:chemotaxis protein MotB